MSDAETAMEENESRERATSVSYSYGRWLISRGIGDFNVVLRVS
jgi:hypothetical protein